MHHTFICHNYQNPHIHSYIIKSPNRRQNKRYYSCNSTYAFDEDHNSRVPYLIGEGCETTQTAACDRASQEALLLGSGEELERGTVMPSWNDATTASSVRVVFVFHRQQAEKREPSARIIFFTLYIISTHPPADSSKIA